MSSWRDQTSSQAQEDLDSLLGATLPFAQQSLQDHGGFMPFGAAVDAAGELRVFAADDGQDSSDATELLRMLWGGLATEVDELRAVAVCSDIRLPTLGKDAIRAVLEHREGTCIDVVLPYSRSKLGRKLKYEPLEAAAGERRLWPG